MKYGQLSNNDIQLEQKEIDGLHIVPIFPESLKGASYDISPTIIAMSTKTGLLETVYCEKKYPHKYFIYVKPKDTVLIISREYIFVPPNISGYVVSRVTKVSEGFGHISTSIDPGWKGALLIALSNPMNKTIKVYVGGSEEYNGVDPLSTITFHYLNTPCESAKIVYSGMRIDLLKKQAYFQRHSIRAWMNKRFHPNRRRFTDLFFQYCENNDLNMDNWEKNSRVFLGRPEKHACVQCKNFQEPNHKRSKTLSDYIITEHFFLRFLHMMQKHWPTIWSTLTIIFSFFVVFGILPDDWKQAIIDFFTTLNGIK